MDLVWARFFSGENRQLAVKMGIEQNFSLLYARVPEECCCRHL